MKKKNSPLLTLENGFMDLPYHFLFTYSFFLPTPNPAFSPPSPSHATARSVQHPQTDEMGIQGCRSDWRLIHSAVQGVSLILLLPSKRRGKQNII